MRLGCRRIVAALPMDARRVIMGSRIRWIKPRSMSNFFKGSTLIFQIEQRQPLVVQGFRKIRH